MNTNAEIGRQLDVMFRAILEVHQATRSHREGREVSRICLHCAEALENYLSDSAPPKYGANLPKGVRSRAGSPDVSDAEVKDYIESVRQHASKCLLTIDLACARDAWGDDQRKRGLPPLKRILYVMRHTQYHLGQISQLVRDSYDIDKLCTP